MWFDIENVNVVSNLDIDQLICTTTSTPNRPIGLFGDSGDSGKARSIKTKLLFIVVVVVGYVIDDPVVVRYRIINCLDLPCYY